MPILINQNLKTLFQEKNKNFWRIFIFLFLLNFILVNWSDISWIFNYKFISRGLLGFFEKNETRAVESELPTVEILKDIKKSDGFKREEKSEIIAGKEGDIEIPKIGVKAPIVFPEIDTQYELQKALRKGVSHYPQSALPGEKGISVILGHSAPPNWPKVNYDWIFNDLHQLNPGDIIYVYYNQLQYNFNVKEKIFLKKGEEFLSRVLTDSKSVLILLSCWPPGRDQERIAVRAELVN